jgi:hypothetical protein
MIEADENTAVRSVEEEESRGEGRAYDELR